MTMNSAANLAIGTYLGKPGIARQTKTFNVILATLSNAAQFHWAPGFSGEIESIVFITHTPATTAAKLATLTPSIDGVDVTGGVLALTTATCDTRDEEVAGTPITALNRFTATSTIRITGSAVTAFSEGVGEIQMRVKNLDLLEYLAGKGLLRVA